MTGTLARYFGLRFLAHADRGVGRRLRAGRAGRLCRDDAARCPTSRTCRRWLVAQDFVLPRAADHRAHPAVLRPDRRDVLLSRPVAAARTRGRARRRHVGLAVHRAGGDRRARRSACSRPRSTIRWPPSCRSAPSAWRPSCPATCAAAALQATASGFWVRQRSTDGQSIINAASSREQGLRLERRHRFHLRSGRPLHGADRGQVGHSRERPLAAQRRARLFRRHAAGRARDLSAQHQPDAGAGARNLLDPGNGAVLGASAISSTWPSAPAWPPPATGCNTRSCWRGRSCWPRWCCWPPPSACASSASAACRRWFWVASASGFLLYVLSKVTEDLSKAELMQPSLAAWLPVLVGGLTGFLVLLYQEDG